VGIDRETFFDIMTAFPTGVAVITTFHDDEPHGFAANAFCSLSLEPPLVLVCAARTSRTRTMLVAAGGFGINILAAEQEEVCRIFARKDADRFGSIPWHPSALGNPHLDGTLAFLDCTLHSLLPGGDHVIFTGQVASAEARDGDPLVFFRGRFGPL
jgi:flavin reductase (DIM6/NTAB) family NADH-FMN oxidoreductase RutF